MSIDSTLLIGYSLDEAQEYLQEEEIAFTVIITSAKRAGCEKLENEELRIIGTRGQDPLELICTRQTWSIHS